MAVTDIVLETIEDQKKTYGIHKSGLIFTNGSGNPIGKSTLWMAWNTAAKKVKTDAAPTTCGTTSPRCTSAQASRSRCSRPSLDTRTPPRPGAPR